jgi:hypothetical protein
MTSGDAIEFANLLQRLLGLERDVKKLIWVEGRLMEGEFSHP